MVIPGGNPKIKCAPPHDNLGKEIESLLVQPLHPDAAETCDLLNGIIEKSQDFLENHRLNAERKSKGHRPANSLWPWSPGRKPKIRSFQERFGISGAAISAVDLIKGLAIYSGLEAISVEGATGLYDTNYEGKAEACLEALKKYDLVLVHVEAPDEAGHSRDLKLKIRCIEDLSQRLVSIILGGIKASKTDTVVAILPDHPTPVACGAHTRDPVPIAIWDPNFPGDSVETLDEESVKSGSLGLLKGSQFIQAVLGKKET
jgi:2,3-bisphosphoglycerate-independent phosphoglycerate mutase